jgi:hypothetical protein
LARRADSFWKKAFTRAFSGIAPYYVVNEFPKSGGTWLCEMLSMALGIPFREREPIRFERSVVHGHFLNPIGLHNVAVIFRDPRDVIVSCYYHFYFKNDRANHVLVDLMKRRLPFDDYDDIAANLPAFIRFISTTPVSPHFSWPAFAAAWAGRQDVTTTTYERLRADTEGELARVIGSLGLQPSGERIDETVRYCSFAAAKQRQEREMRPGTEVPFIRAGSLGGWRSHFSPAAEAELVRCGYAEPMRALGYKI